MVGLEGMGGRAAGDGLHHRRFHFDKAGFFKKPADLSDDGNAFAEDFARSGIRNQIKVSLPVFRFGILDSVPFFGQRTQGLGKHGQRLDPDRRLAGFRGEPLALHANPVSYVQLLEDGHSRLTNLLGVHKDLHPAGIVGKIEKPALSHVPVRGDSSGRPNCLAFAKRREDLFDSPGHLEFRSKGSDSGSPQGLELLPSDGDGYLHVMVYRLLKNPRMSRPAGCANFRPSRCRQASP